MEQIICDEAFAVAWLDMPFQPDTRDIEGRVPDDYLHVPGIHLKTIGRSPQKFAKLASCSDEKVVVISKPDALCDFMKCIWIGTPEQYARMWTVD